MGFVGAAQMMLAATNAFLAGLEHHRNADALAAAFAAHLAHVTSVQLPVDAQPVWREIARLARFDAMRPVLASALAAMRSWPAQRTAELVEHVRRLDAILEGLENQRLEDEIRDSIRHHYL